MFLTSPDGNLIHDLRRQGNAGPVLAEAFVSFDDSKKAGLESAASIARWATLGVAGDAELPRASIFSSASKTVTPADLASITTAGRDQDDYLATAQTYADAGVTGISLVNAGPDPSRFIDFAAKHLIDGMHRLSTSRHSNDSSPRGALQ